MPDESHVERIVRLETQHESMEASVDRMSKEIAAFVAESREARQADALRHTEDHRRIHGRITDGVDEARKAILEVSQTVRDARMMGKGAWLLACALGAGVAWGAQKAVEFFATKGHP